MTDTEATRIVGEAMPDVAWHPQQYDWFRAVGNAWVEFDPITNANDEQLVREWARDNLTYAELRRAGTIACGFPACPTDVFKIKTGDLTRAVAQVISERKGGDAT